MELSKRLQAVADLVSEGVAVADVGTDHGYIPIYLCSTNRCPKAVAMDVNQGPLLRAEAHIQEYKLETRIETRLSDGVKKLLPGEYECVVIAGMGGALTVRILTEGEDVFRSLKEFVLQPQSELWKVRQYLTETGYVIVREDMVYEDGKYYPMMKVTNGQSSAYDKIELRYGIELLVHKNPILKQFLEKELSVKEEILQNLLLKEGLHIEERRNSIKEELEGIQCALQRYYNCN